MKINKTYTLLLKKSVTCMLSAIEIFNKPNFGYREDVFAILCVNSWELLLKAILLRVNKYRMNSVYEMQPKLKKDTTPSKILEPVLNRCDNPKTINLLTAIKRLKEKEIVTDEIEKNLEALMELRDNAIHFANFLPMSKMIQELGFASIKNYMSFISKNDIDVDLTKYNFYLMPLAYVDSKVDACALLTDKEQKYVNFIKRQLDANTNQCAEYDIMISIDINFKKGNSVNALAIKYDHDGIPIRLSEEAFRKRFPLLYKDVCVKCKELYSDYKKNEKFNAIMRKIKENSKLCYVRKLDNNNPHSAKTMYYSTNIFQVFDTEYTRKSNR